MSFPALHDEVPFLLTDPSPDLVDAFRAQMRDRDAYTLHDKLQRLQPVRAKGSGESSLHALIKAELALAAKAAGWNVTLEARGSTWRADVLAELDGMRVALEVQMSSCSLREYRRRQALYEADGVRCVWLCSYYPKGYVPDPALVLLRVAATEQGELVVGLPERARSYAKDECIDTSVVEVQAAITQLLNGSLRYLDSAHVQPYVELIGWDERCWRCHSYGSHAWDVSYHGQSACGLGMDIKQTAPGYESRLASQVVAFAECMGLTASIAERSSKTLGRAYNSFGCRSCDAIYGDWFLRDTMMELAYNPPLWGVLPAPSVDVARSHWCQGAACKSSCSSPAREQLVALANGLWLPV
jgi:hypothetical protein